MEEIRCLNCKKLLLKSKIPYHIEIKCTKCKKIQTQGKTEMQHFNTIDNISSSFGFSDWRKIQFKNTI